jgi:hypothetical protein
MITKEDIQNLFNETKKDGQWNLDGPMLFGYFFTNSNIENLILAKDFLIEKGYDFVDLFLADKDVENEEDLYFLHVEKVETHSVESLDKLNQIFYRLASEFNLDSYDGFDYGLAK